MLLIASLSGHVQNVVLVVLAERGPFGQIRLCSTCIHAVNLSRLTLAVGVVLALVPHVAPVGLVCRGPPGCSQPLGIGACQREEDSTTALDSGTLPIVHKLALPLSQ